MMLLELRLNRLSRVEINTIDNNIFRPINISPDIYKRLQKMLKAIGVANPLEMHKSA